MLIRYGPDVLSKDEYRRLRRELRDYLCLHARRRIKRTDGETGVP